MDISVIVATYNHGKTIGRTLDSILSQTFPGEMEIIIGDDCSSDNTEKICREYAARYPEKIKYLRRQRNLGLLKNYFDCVDRASGKYIADLAGDDFWTDNGKLEKQFKIMESDPDVTLVATGWRCCNLDGSNVREDPDAPLINEVREIDSPDILSMVMSCSLTTHLCTALYRRDVIADYLEKFPGIMLDPEYNCEDQQILAALACSGKFVYLPDVTLHYSVGHESISHQKTFEKKFSYSEKALRQKRKLQLFFGVDDSVMKGVYAKTTKHLIAMAFRSGNPGLISSARTLQKELKLSPAVKSCLYIAVSRCGLLWKLFRNFINSRR